MQLLTLPSSDLQFKITPADSNASEPTVFVIPEHESVTRRQEASLQSTSSSGKGSISILPIGREGEAIWNSLPLEIGAFVAPPAAFAAVAIGREILTKAEGESLWKLVSERPANLTVLSSVDGDQFTTVQTPPLSLQSSSIPAWLSAKIDSLTFEDVVSKPDAIAIKAGLLQIHGELDRSHDYAQDCQGEGRHVAGDYWHAIMHRREPDYGNSKYWFRRVGDHPLFSDLADGATTILNRCDAADADKWLTKLTSSGWDPFAFVDLCEACARGNSNELTKAAQQIQYWEMLLLLKQTCRDTFGE